MMHANSANQINTNNNGSSAPIPAPQMNGNGPHVNSMMVANSAQPYPNNQYVQAAGAQIMNPTAAPAALPFIKKPDESAMMYAAQPNVQSVNKMPGDHPIAPGAAQLPVNMQSQISTSQPPMMQQAHPAPLSNQANAFGMPPQVAGMTQQTQYQQIQPAPSLNANPVLINKQTIPIVNIATNRIIFSFRMLFIF